MKKAWTLPGHVYVQRTRSYIETATGKKISRRAMREKILNKRSFEEKAAANKAADTSLSSARPAKGRKSQVVKLKTGFDPAQIKAIAKRYPTALSGFNKEFYMTWNNKKQHYGTVIIEPEWLMMNGHGMLPGTDDLAHREHVEIVGLYKSLLSKARGWKDAIGYQVQAFILHNDEIRAADNSYWNHSRRIIDDDIDPQEFYTMLENGTLSGSSSGPCVMLTFRVFFNEETQKLRAPAAKAKRDAYMKKYKLAMAKKIAKQQKQQSKQMSGK
jgi:hypothetical protein